MCRYVRFGTGLLSISVAMLLAVGCGTGSSMPKAKVKGSATLDDKPIKFGLITFQATAVTGSPVQDYIKDGQYTIPEINFGKYQVHLTAESDAPAQVANQPAGEASSDMMRAMKKGKSPSDVGARMQSRPSRGTADDPNPIENAMRRAKGMADNIMPLNAIGNDTQVDVTEKDQTIDFKLKSPGKK